MVLRLDEIWMTTHFSVWKVICHCFFQSSSAARSCCRSSVSFLLKMGLYSRQSYAKRRASKLVTSWRSLMKVKKSGGPRTVPVVPLITLLLLMKYGHRGGLVAICCWGSPWSIEWFVHALHSTVVCGEASGELQCQTLLRSQVVWYLLDPHWLGYVRCCQWWLITGSHRNVWIWSRVVYHSGWCVCRNDPSPDYDYGRYALKAYKLLKSERRGDSWMLDVGHLSWKPVQLKLIAAHLVYCLCWDISGIYLSKLELCSWHIHGVVWLEYHLDLWPCDCWYCWAASALQLHRWINNSVQFGMRGVHEHHTLRLVHIFYGCIMQIKNYYYYYYKISSSMFI